MDFKFKSFSNGVKKHCKINVFKCKCRLLIWENLTHVVVPLFAAAFGCCAHCGRFAAARAKGPATWVKGKWLYNYSLNPPPLGLN